MTMQPHPALSTTPGSTTEILAIITDAEPPGATADHVARALGFARTGRVVQDALEELVARGLLDRRGLGRGALYTRRTGV